MSRETQEFLAMVREAYHAPPTRHKWCSHCRQNQPVRIETHTHDDGSEWEIFVCVACGMNTPYRVN